MLILNSAVGIAPSWSKLLYKSEDSQRFAVTAAARAVVVIAIVAVAIVAITIAAAILKLRQWFFTKPASLQTSEVWKHLFPVWIKGIQSYPVSPFLVVKVFFRTGSQAVAGVVRRPGGWRWRRGR